MSCGAPSREARLQITDLICQVAELQGRTIKRRMK
jgi:hypothetical protein